LILARELPCVYVSNVLSDDKKQQVIALGRLGWSLRRIEAAVHIRRETVAGYLRAAGVPVRPPGGWGKLDPAKPAIFALLVDQQWLWKENRALDRRLRAARLKERGVMEDVDYQHPRGLDRKLLRTLAGGEWVKQHQNILLIGSTGLGKTWLACALAQKACRDGHTVLHKRAAELFREFSIAHADGSRQDARALITDRHSGAGRLRHGPAERRRTP
jgi:hypothetical protein